MHWAFYIKQVFARWGIDKTIKCLNFKLDKMHFLNNILMYYEEVPNEYSKLKVNSSIDSRKNILN